MCAPSTATPLLLSRLFQSFLHLMQLSISWRRTAHQPQRGYLEHTIQAERTAALTSCNPLCNDESSTGGVTPPITDDGAGTCFTRLSSTIFFDNLWFLLFHPSRKTSLLKSKDNSRKATMTISSRARPAVEFLPPKQLCPSACSEHDGVSHPFESLLLLGTNLSSLV